MSQSLPHILPDGQAQSAPERAGPLKVLGHALTRLLGAAPEPVLRDGEPGLSWRGRRRERLARALAEAEREYCAGRLSVDRFVARRDELLASLELLYRDA
jgi:hypothetical protein